MSQIFTKTKCYSLQSEDDFDSISLLHSTMKTRCSGFFDSLTVLSMKAHPGWQSFLQNRLKLPPANYALLGYTVAGEKSGFLLIFNILTNIMHKGDWSETKQECTRMKHPCNRANIKSLSLLFYLWGISPKLLLHAESQQVAGAGGGKLDGVLEHLRGWAQGRS